MIVELPPPYAFGLPEKFKGWREDQQEAFQLILDAPTRFVGLTMPVGSGKSLAYMAALKLSAGRGVVLTSTKGLQDQLGEDYGELAMDLRGQVNYPCKALGPGGEFAHFLGGHYNPHDPPTCQEGPCHAGMKCTLKEAGCEYYDRLRICQLLPTITNYSLWLAQKRYGQGMGRADLLVLDEAHQAADELANSLTVKVEKWMLQAVGITNLPPINGPLQVWKDWAKFHSTKLKAKVEGLGSPSSSNEVKARRRMKAVERALTAMSEMELGNWVEDHDEQSWKFEVLNPAAYAEQYLFQGAKKVVLLSATLTEKTMSLLGIQEATMWECPSRFDVARRPVYYIPTVSVDYKMKPEHWTALIGRVDQIIAPRQDRKGILHSGSYKRRDHVIALSGHNSIMVTHGNKPGEAAQTVKWYKQRQAPCVLVSPSLTTGWDFPYDQCRYQIILKLPFPDTQSAVMKARCEMDKEYLAYLTAQTLQQTVGRGMRAPDDWCETFLLDDHWRWFQKNKKLFTRSFLEAVRVVQTLPKPLKFAA